MDLYDIASGFPSELDALKQIQAKTLIISVSSDILFTPQQQDELVDALKAAGVSTHHIHHDSNYGHDAFLVETDKMGEYIQEFISA